MKILTLILAVSALSFASCAGTPKKSADNCPEKSGQCCGKGNAKACPMHTEHGAAKKKSS